MVLGACEALLKRMGYRVTAVSIPAAALARLRSSLTSSICSSPTSRCRDERRRAGRASRNIRPDLAIVLTTGFLDEATRPASTDAGVTTCSQSPTSLPTSAPSCRPR